MIAEREGTRTVTSTLDSAESVQMGIDQNALAHIMNVLTDLYSDQELAIVREYSTNALDAHIEAGVNRPIEVTLPSSFSPFLRIKDFGTGLNREDIRTIYSQYGNSTKRATNDQVGMLGLGCKSALTYTDQFSVISVKNGRLINVSIERDENGAGVMKVLSKDIDGDPTDKPNGTEIVIPAKGGNGIRAKAEKFFRFWKTGTVKIDGVEPTPIEGLKLDDRLLAIDGEQSYVVMGNVAYPAEINHGLPRGYRHGAGYIDSKSICAFVGIGEVNFPPSREALMMTTKTKATLAKINADVKAGLTGAVQREIDKAPSTREAAMAYLKYARDLGQENASYTFRGLPLPKKFEPTMKLSISDGNGGDANPPMLVTNNSDYKMSRAAERDSLPLGLWDGSYILYGYNRRGVTAPQKRKMMQHLADSSSTFTVSRFVLVAEKPTAEQIEMLGADHMAPWADVEAIKLPVKGTAAVSAYGRLPGSYDLYEGFDKAAFDAALATDSRAMGYTWHHGMAGDQIDQSKPIFWLHGNMSRAARYIDILAKAHRATGCYVIGLASNRVDKFCRNMPAAKTVHQGAKDAWDVAIKAITDEQRLALTVYDSGSHSDLMLLDPKKLKDPDLHEAIRLAHLDVSLVTDLRRQFSSVLDGTDLDAVQWSDPLDKYPLFQHYREVYYARNSAGSKFSPDMYLYMNAKYDHIQASKSPATTKGA